MSGIRERLVGIVGESRLLESEGDKAPYSTDATHKYKGSPEYVAKPETAGETAALVRLANEAKIPVVPMGGNTGLSGGAACGPGRCIVISMERMSAIREIKPQARVVIAEAGVVLDRLREEADRHGLVFPLVFGARGSCMIGGNLATNAGGSNVLRYGNTRDLCLGLEVVTPTGEIMNILSELHKDNTGYDLKDLVIGSEGTLGIITAAALRLMPKPKAYATAMVAVPGLDSALALLNRLGEETGGMVEAFEYMPAEYFEMLLRRFPDMRAPFREPAETGVLLEVGAVSERDAAPGEDGRIPLESMLQGALAAEMAAGRVIDAVVAKSERERKEMWARREAAYEVTAVEGAAISADVSVPLDRVGQFLETMAARLREARPQAKAVPIAHLGDGNLHYTVWPTPGDPTPASDEVTQGILSAVEDVVAEMGGSFSAEHGIGLTKIGSMRRRKDPVALKVMRQIKAAMDPNGIMNPGKVLPD